MRLTSGLLTLIVGVTSLAASAQIQNFEHIIILIQENRTPDNLFQGLCSRPYGTCAVPPTQTAPYDIQTSNWSTTGGGTIQPVPVPLANGFDLGHGHDSFNIMCDMIGGKSPTCQMDGAAGIQCQAVPPNTCPLNPQFMYVDNSTGILDPYLTLATQYGWANYMFQTNQGPSYPAHLFLFAGTSAPSPEDDASGIFAAESVNPFGSAGCITPPNTKSELISPSLSPLPPFGIEDSSAYPCFEVTTMADLVPDWMYYTTWSIWSSPNSINHICVPENGECTGWGTHVVSGNTAPSQILTDIGNCNFHNLTWLIPTGQNSDHPQNNDGGGPSWVASVVNAIGNSTCTDLVNGQPLTYWQDTAILIVWDDWGGWYDHEAPTILPKPQGDYQYGFRVPFIVVSAYTNPHFVDNERNDFGSILRFIERNFADLGIREGQLGFADRRISTDLRAFFHLNLPPRTFVPIAAPKGADFFINDRRPPLPPDND